jgi:hypothetical protein
MHKSANYSKQCNALKPVLEQTRNLNTEELWKLITLIKEIQKGGIKN